MSGIVVCKFGGTSLGDASCFKRVRDIIHGDKRRRYVVVSAPGKRAGDEMKITDMLARAYGKSASECEKYLTEISARFASISHELGMASHAAVTIDFDRFSTLSEAGALSLGERYCAKILAEYIGFPYVDAADIFKFRNGTLDAAATYETMRTLPENAVIPGFYGANERGEIVTFPRGGSDISAAHLAAGLGAELYENWTDVDGFRTADPAFVPDPQHISHMNYDEARIFAYMGASVLHPDAIAPAASANIPIVVRNSFAPAHSGTLICENARCELPCLAARALPSGKYLITPLFLTPAMGERLQKMLDGNLATECAAKELPEKLTILHSALMSMAQL